MLTTFLIATLIAALVLVVVFWVVDAIPVPPPANTIIKIIAAILVLLFVLQRTGIALP